MALLHRVVPIIYLLSTPARYDWASLMKCHTMPYFIRVFNVSKGLEVSRISRFNRQFIIIIISMKPCSILHTRLEYGYKTETKLFNFHRIFKSGGQGGGSCETPLDPPQSLLYPNPS